MRCSVGGCVKNIVARGWCAMHHSRWLRHGVLELPFVSCDECGKKHQRSSFGLRGRGPHHFCSYECNYRFASKKRSSAVMWPTDQTCIVCGVSYRPRPQAVAIQRYCSASCRVTYCRYREWAVISRPLMELKQAIKEKM